MSGHLVVKQLGLRPYTRVWQAMREYTQQRDGRSTDQLWLLQHPPVYTLGQAGRPEHLLDPGDIPVLRTDRGGQVTYHGPGQLIAYLLLDLPRAGLGIRALVSLLEQTVVALLAQHRVTAQARAEAPGVYVGERKIASIGLRVRRGCTFHGLSLNVDMDLEPFSRINPCGYPGLQVTQLADLGIRVDLASLGLALSAILASGLGYTWEAATTESSPESNRNP